MLNVEARFLLRLTPSTIGAAGTWARGPLRYYQDRVTGSTYSLGELEELLQGTNVDLREVLPLFTDLPYGTCCLLEQAESIAAEVARDERRPFRS